MVYHGLGDKYNASTYMLGTCASDYKKSSSIAGDFTDRANGNGYGNRTIRYDYNAWINLYSVGLKNNNDSDWNLDSLSGSGDYYNINMSILTTVQETCLSSSKTFSSQSFDMSHIDFPLS